MKKKLIEFLNIMVALVMYLSVLYAFLAGLYIFITEANSKVNLLFFSVGMIFNTLLVSKYTLSHLWSDKK